MRVLHLITGLNIGGAETMLMRLLTATDRSRFQSRVTTLLEPGPLAEPIRKLGVEVTGLGMSRGIPSPAALFRLVRIIRKWKPDVVQTWLYHADLMGLIAARLACQGKVAWNLRCSFMDLEKYRKTTSWTLKACSLFSKRPDAIAANSQAAMDYHRSIGYRPRREAILPNGFDTDQFRPDPATRGALRHELGIDENTPLVGLVARFDPMKDHQTFFRAAATVLQSVPEASFVLAGTGMTPNNPAVMDMVDQSGVRENCHLLGPRQDIPAIQAALDLGVCSSIGESFPTVVGEAMSSGVPCVVTDVGDAASIVGNSGLVVKPSDPDQLAEAIVRMLQMPIEQRNKLGESARERVLCNYSLGAVARMYEEFYTEICPGP